MPPAWDWMAGKLTPSKGWPNGPPQSIDGDGHSPDGETTTFEVISRLDTEVEVAYFQNGGILPYVLRRMLDE